MTGCACRAQYAAWEEGQKDFRRARSVWERTLDVTYTNPTVWLRYAEMEMRHRFINHARNVWDRAVSLLPRVDQLWCAPCRRALARALMVHARHSQPAPRSYGAGYCTLQLMPQFSKRHSG